MLYGPRMTCGPIWTLRGWQEKPVSKYSVAWRAVNRPSLVTPVLSVMALAERGLPRKNSASRDRTSLTGRRVARASSTQYGSMTVCSLPPKPPPTWGTITRTWLYGRSKSWARRARTVYVLWVLVHTVTLPLGSTWATLAIGSKYP